LLPDYIDLLNGWSTSVTNGREVRKDKKWWSSMELVARALDLPI
jgi:hypothetical protein